MNDLSVKARQVRNAGRYEDTQLVHLSDEELAMLRQQWGVPGKNPDTGLPEYGILGSIIKKVAPFAVSFIPGIGPIAAAALGAGLGAAGSALVSGKKGKSGSASSATGYTPVAKDPTFSAKLPEARGIFADLAAKPSGMTPEDFLTYGQVNRTPQGVTMGKTGAQFFNYAKSPEQQMPEANVYFDAYPDVAAEYTKLSGSPEGQATLAAIGVKTPQQFASWHFSKYGSGEQRTAPKGYVPPKAIDPAVVPPVPVAPSDLAVQEYKKGGSVRKEFAVHGEGTGRSDSIPAVLSDGEYVIDAETVALLGDGSSKAGAEALDAFRVNLRKHKGAKLAQGKFSVKAKRPHQYMTGGKV